MNQLPEEIIGPSSFRSILLMFVAVLATVFVVNLGMSWFLRNDTTNLGVHIIRAKWSMLQDLDEPVDLLILGDSSANQGVSPDVIREKLGVTSVNLATIGSVTAVNDAWMLNFYIDRHGPPRAVVIVHVYDVWHREVNKFSMLQIPLPLGFWRDFEPEVGLSVKDQFLTRYAPLYNRNKTLSRLFLSPKTIPETIRPKFPPPSGNGYMMEADPDLARVQRDVRSHLSFVRDNEFRVSPTNQAALERIIALANEHQFEVFLANGPLNDALYEDDHFRAYFDQLSQELDLYADSSDRVHYILRKPMTFPKEQMQNADHVIHDSAMSYSQKLSEEIGLVVGATEDR